MKRKILLFILLLGSASLFAAENPQWEYLVLTYGKTYFEDAEKTNMYFPLTREFGQEALSLQQSLDGLGKLGWELISIVGTISGDQQLILKRIYREENQKTDADIIRQETEKMNTEWQERLEKERLANEQNDKLLAEKKVLVDLDEADKNAEFQKNKNDFTAYCKYIESVLSEQQNAVSVTGQDQSYQYVITVSYDVTDTFVSNGNEFRSSEVTAYFDKLKEKIDIDTDKLGWRRLIIQYIGYVTLDGSQIVVYNRENKYTW